MNIQELTWLRENVHKLDKELRAEILGQYRSLTKIPCVLQKIFRVYQKRFTTIPVIIQMSPLRNPQHMEVESFFRNKKKNDFINLELVNSFSARLSFEEIKEIVSNSAVNKIYLDREINALLNNAISTIEANRLWDNKYTGKGITIAVLDSGIYLHPDFIQPENRILAFSDFTEKKRPDPYDDNGHGTHCTAAAAGNGFLSGGLYRGPAYDANLIMLKILDKMGSGNTSQALKALDWCHRHKEKYNIRIISLSLGYKASESYRDDLLCQALGKLWDEGMIICTAAGNEGPEAKTIYSPGIHPKIITVGACDDIKTPDPADNLVAEFSSRGPTLDGLTKPDLLAPGTNIISARVKGSYLDKTSNTGSVSEGYIALSGTSMATPICAGVCAQLLQANPELTPSEVKQVLLNTCTKLAAFDANSQGSGCINARHAYAHASVSNPG